MVTRLKSSAPGRFERDIATGPLQMTSFTINLRIYNRAVELGFKT